MFNPALALGAADQTPRPEAAAAGGMDVAEAVLPVLVCHFTTVAEDTRGKIKVLEPLSQLPVAALIPDLEKGALAKVSHKILPGGTFPLIEIV